MSRSRKDMRKPRIRAAKKRKRKLAAKNKVLGKENQNLRHEIKKRDQAATSAINENR